MSLVELSFTRYQSRGVSRALPWVARRRSGSLTVVRVRAGCPGSGGVWWGGLWIPGRQLDYTHTARKNSRFKNSKINRKTSVNQV